MIEEQKKYRWIKTPCDCLNESNQECYKIHHKKIYDAGTDNKVRGKRKITN